nr:serine/threonine-protein kinase [Nitrosomonas nitrosa]
MANKLPIFSTTFGNYRAVKILGEGGSGRVFAAEGDDGKQYAIKLLDSENATREKARRFKNEILFGIRNHHKNIVSIIDHGLWTGGTSPRQFYVMPVYASTLRLLIKAGIKPEKILPLFGQILDGLEAAHLLGVVHRDVKPENILIDSGSIPLIADFGIAHFTAEELANTVETKLGSRLANFIYAAPEQRQQSRVVDLRADIFALGLILNEMYTGDIPHGTGYATIKSRYPAFGFLDTLVSSMIAQRPEDRPQTIDQIKKNLIAHQQEFIAQQKLDAMKTKVIPTVEVDSPIARQPIEVLGGDWRNGLLSFKLSQVPPQPWIDIVKNSASGGISYFMNYPPELIAFNGDIAHWQSSESAAQGQIDQFKQRVTFANSAYVRQLAEAARRQEQETRRRLHAEIQAEEKRQQIANRLKF